VARMARFEQCSGGVEMLVFERLDFELRHRRGTIALE
jgi:hypothetical protein